MVWRTSRGWSDGGAAAFQSLNGRLYQIADQCWLLMDVNLQREIVFGQNLLLLPFPPEVRHDAVIIP
eukprot:Skav231848  [mRNA]  locus=scaffold2215:372642:373700:- [translate_table: standard]